MTWQSGTHDGGFYFGWEDGLGGGDNDFEDILAFVTGLACSSDGTVCDTGKEGVCAHGTRQCVRGEVSCSQSIASGPELCNALDDDCDGETDEGELCGSDEVCFSGKCVPKCTSGEFPCPGGYVCDDEGGCVEKACAEVDCGPREVCSNGACIDGCAGVNCPTGQSCFGGACVDLCELVECDPGFACVQGVCQECNCAGCDEGFTCIDNVCVHDACVNQTCSSGTRCVQGTCVDRCTGVACPVGSNCEAGYCVPAAPDPEGAGGADSRESDGPTLVYDDGGSNSIGAADAGVHQRLLRGNAGWGCRATGTGLSPWWASLFALLLAALPRLRRRR